MTDDEKARIILEELSKFVDIDFDKESEKWYRYGILNGLSKIELRELEAKKD